MVGGRRATQGVSDCEVCPEGGDFDCHKDPEKEKE